MGLELCSSPNPPRVCFGVAFQYISHHLVVQLISNKRCASPIIFPNNLVRSSSFPMTLFSSESVSTLYDLGMTNQTISKQRIRFSPPSTPLSNISTKQKLHSVPDSLLDDVRALTAPLKCWGCTQGNLSTWTSSDTLADWLRNQMRNFWVCSKRAFRWACSARPGVCWGSG